MNEELLVYIDGEYYPKHEAKVSVYDHGFLYGDGVFEGIRAYDGVVFKLKEHIDRLYHSANTIMLDVPMTKDEMINAVLETLRRNGLKTAYVRLIVTRGVGDLGLDPRKCKKPSVIIIVEPTIVVHEVKEKGLKAIITWVRRDPIDATSHEVKSMNYLNSILAKMEANIAGVDEAILLDKHGFVCEGSAQNLFIVKDEVLITPPSSTGALLGITRDTVMRIAERLGYKVVERNVTPHELFNADEVFFTGTATEVAPVVEINKRRVGEGTVGPITKRIMEEFYKVVRDPNEGILIPHP